LVRKRKRYYSAKNIADMKGKLATVGPKADRLMMQFVTFPFTNPRAKEYAAQGFARRIQTLRQCIENVFRLVPPTAHKVPDKWKLRDAGINLQAFIANVYGILDNLAWIWVYERGHAGQIGRKQIGLLRDNKRVRASLPAELRSYLEKMDGKWSDYLTEYRHALAHRIPLYIPPGGVLRSKLDAYNDLTTRMNEAMAKRDFVLSEKISDEQDAMLVFQPLMTHSTSETKGHYPFHVQIIADFLTVEEVGQKVLTALRRSSLEKRV